MTLVVVNLSSRDNHSITFFLFIGALSAFRYHMFSIFIFFVFTYLSPSFIHKEKRTVLHAFQLTFRITFSLSMNWFIFDA